MGQGQAFPFHSAESALKPVGSGGRASGQVGAIVLVVILRSTLLFLARQKQLRRWFETSKAADRVTRRFVAGHTLEQAIAVCRKLNAEKILVTLDRLGENVTSLEEASASRDAYIAALEEIASSGIQSTISIKLTQFGLGLDTEACTENVDMLVSRARELGTRIEIDMESSEYVDRTLAIVTGMHQRHHAVRAVIQAYLRRSERDVERLNAIQVPVRLCKGAYKEPARVAFPSKRKVDANYMKLTRLLLERGTVPAIATHDPKMLNNAIEQARKLGLGSNQFEFQMLYGIRRDLQARLVGEGYRLRLYVPYGDAWYPYFMRRLAERPANLLFLARNFFRH